ncbi:hypothetical protein F53441_13181 [Fusarium austroafricanum]|uniref:Uncharacterized protein n=1 Tax=Fusarium austroafricanum TaxID=2364996 RepID=A0A8H4JRC9_9HYPO|nr:hypothetical protein F53441_13181 [Fusarium austroafricanum]
MPPRTRQSCRLQSSDIDELADYKIGIASMLINPLQRPQVTGPPPNTKRRGPGRPPKPQSPGRPSEARKLGRPAKVRGHGRPGRPPKTWGHGRPSRYRSRTPGLPRSKRPGRRRKSYPPEHNDQWIAERLQWNRKTVTMGKRVGDACRSVLELSGQWPWELAANFLPRGRGWGISLVEDLRKLFRIVHSKVATNDYGDNFQVVKDFLHSRAYNRDQDCPQLKLLDIREAVAHFSVRHYRRAKGRRSTTATTEIMLLTSLVESDEEDEDESETREREGRFSRDDFEDYTGDHGHGGDYDTEPTSQDDTTVKLGKRSRSSSELSEALKRARVAEFGMKCDNCQNTMSPNATAKATHTQSTTDVTRRPQSFIDIVKSFDFFMAEKERELEAVSYSLREARTLVQASQTALAKSHSTTNNDGLDELYLAIREIETKKEKKLEGQKVFEQTYAIMDMEADDVAKQRQQYTSQLEEFDRLINEKNAEVRQEVELIHQRLFELEERFEMEREEEKRLKVREEEVGKELAHYRTIGAVTKMRKSETTILQTKLESNDFFKIKPAMDNASEAAHRTPKDDVVAADKFKNAARRASF